MAQLDEIVSFTITEATSTITVEAFNIPMFLANFVNFSERTREYTSLTAVAADFRSTSNVYKAAQKYFGQDTAPSKIIIGRRQSDGVDGSVATVANTTVYTITINGIAVTYTSDGTATATEIATGLKAAFDAAKTANAGLTPNLDTVTMTDNLDGTFDIDVSPAGTAWSAVATTNLTLTPKTPTETWVDALNAVEAENDTWYAFSCEDHTDATILALAADAEGRRAMYFTSSSASGIITSSTSDIASQLKLLGYDNTVLLYHPSAGTYFPECGWVGSQITKTPGSNTWKFKQIAGVPTYKLTDTQVGYTKNKNCNIYRAIAGQAMTSEGMSVSGGFIDSQILFHWIIARVQERVYFRLINSLKVPNTNPGYALIEADIRAIMTEAQVNGGVATDPAPRYVTPNARTISPTLKAQRRAEPFQVYFTIAGAIHSISIEGFASV